MSWLSRVAGAALLALPLCVGAHSEGDAGEDIYAMDCEHLPKDALRELPLALARWAHIMCLPTGQALVKSENAQWRFPGSFTDNVMFPARSAQDENDGMPRYFTHIAFRQLTDDEARTRHQRLLRENALYADRLTDATTHQAPASPQAAWEMVGTNNANVSYEIYFMQHAGAQDIWGLVCAPACESHLSFLVTPYN